jgi:hypothetical protein
MKLLLIKYIDFINLEVEYCFNLNEKIKIVYLYNMS